LDIRGYTLDHKMMDNSPDEGKNRVYPDAGISDAISIVAEGYKMSADIDSVHEVEWSRLQKAGVSDYDFVKGLSNMTGFLFWVDGSADGTWTLHFKDPGDSSLLKELQKKELTFKYNNGDFTSLLSFDAEYALRGARTKLRAQTLNPDTNELLVSEFEDDSRSPDVGYTGDTEDQISEPQTTAGAVKIFFGDFSIEIVANKKFKTSADVKSWAEQWFRRQRENFVLGRGKIVGVETLMARQTHNLEGIGKSLSGKYYFTRVRHIMTNNNGYDIDFNVRKVLD
jgi:phage protein D